MKVDWEGVERTSTFRELVQRRRSFVVPCTIFFLVYYMLFIALAGYAPDFMGEKITGGLTVGYLLALSQFVMVWGLGWAYLRKSSRDFDPLRERVVRDADGGGGLERADDRVPAGPGGGAVAAGARDRR
jgi:uncharacterized membrane protein (DUF485 family)